ncbi:MAG: hypothetical protein IT557_14100 [Alphaproteobacteria bacterium]|nr:hypothetical protein [Alphaproteobacteria bacterium]
MKRNRPPPRRPGHPPRPAAAKASGREGERQSRFDSRPPRGKGSPSGREDRPGRPQRGPGTGTGPGRWQADRREGGQQGGRPRREDPFGQDRRPAGPRDERAEGGRARRFASGPRKERRADRFAEHQEGRREERPRREAPFGQDRPQRGPGGQRHEGRREERPRREAPFGQDRPQRGPREREEVRFRPGRGPSRAAEDRPAPPRPHPAGPAAHQAPHPAEGGPYWLFGLHAVAAALANPARRLRRLAATAEGEAALAVAVPPPWLVRPERLEREALARLVPPGAVHQGLALLADPLSSQPLAEALAARPDAPVLVLDQVTDPRNVGAILRVAAAFGAAAVIVQDRHAPPETGTLARAAAGALERVPVLRAVNIARTLGALKEAGLWVVGLEAAGPVTLRRAGLGQRRTALVLGGEGEGLRRLTRETCDELCRLPMAGGVESLNVSTAAAVALYELTADRLDTEGAK